jgi:hypothetical protein
MHAQNFNVLSFFYRFDDAWNMTYKENAPRILIENTRKHEGGVGCGSLLS